MADLIDAIEDGLTYENACKSAGVSYRAFCYWRKRGEAELKRIEEEEKKKELKAQGEYKGKIGRLTPYEKERIYVELVQRLERAKATGERELVSIVKQSARGGYLVTKTEVVQVTKNGEVVEERVVQKEETTLPDWKAAMAILRARYGYENKQVNINIDAMLDLLPTEDLDRIAQGEDATQVIAELLARMRQD